MRLVSLVPSLTHMACDFGLQPEIVGCTTFCIHPPGLARTAKLIGGTKDPDIDAIRALHPTHILVNEEENKPEHIAACSAIAPTLTTFPKHPREVPAMLRQAGAFLNVTELSERAAAATENLLDELAQVVSRRAGAGLWRARRYLYYIWREPYMVAGGDTYISAMLSIVGYVNVAAGDARYPELSIAEAKGLAPDLLLLSSEPYPFRRRDGERLRHEWPDAPELLKIDGQLLSWYGTMTHAALVALRRWVEGQDAALVSRLS